MQSCCSWTPRFCGETLDYPPQTKNTVGTDGSVWAQSLKLLCGRSLPDIAAIDFIPLPVAKYRWGKRAAICIYIKIRLICLNMLTPLYSHWNTFMFQPSREHLQGVLIHFKSRVKKLCPRESDLTAAVIIWYVAAANGQVTYNTLLTRNV